MAEINGNSLGPIKDTGLVLSGVGSYNIKNHI